MRGSPCLFSCHNADKTGYLGDFWLSQCATNKLDYFQCGVLYHTEFDFLWLFIHLRPRKNGFKYPAILARGRGSTDRAQRTFSWISLIGHWTTRPRSTLLRWPKSIYYPLKETYFGYVSICSIYFICQKSSHRFLPFSDIVLIEFIK